MTRTFKVTIPLSVTVEIAANDGPATAQMIADIFCEAFREDRASDPMAGIAFTLPHDSFFTVSKAATVKMAVLRNDNEIDVAEA